MENVKNHFNSESKEFDDIILKLIPYYDEMVKAITESIMFKKDESFYVLDLGCGTGTISKRIKENYPNARITCLDIAENMIEMAKNKMADYDDIDFIVNDFVNFQFDKKYDVIVSSLAIHHIIDDKDKKIFYTKCFEHLNKNGCFYNADVVLASSEKHQDMFLQKWIEYMKRCVSEKEIQTKWLVTYKEEDHPAKLFEQLNWLQDIGYSEIDVIWKYYNFAVYGGRKY